MLPLVEILVDPLNEHLDFGRTYPVLMMAPDKSCLSCRPNIHLVNEAHNLLKYARVYTCLMQDLWV